MKRGFHRVVTSACLLVAGTLAALAQTAEGEDPFKPRNADAKPPDGNDAELNALELAGITFIGAERLFNFVDPRSRRSFWVPLNGSSNGIVVNSYDSGTDSVVVQRGQATKTIRLRRSVILAVAQSAPVMPSLNPGGAPVVAPAPGTSTSGFVTTGSTEIVNPKTPQQIAQAETEARMLVSDLLEISMQERARQRALREGRPPPAQQQPQIAPLVPQR